jgi:hypothetical protein
MSNKDSYLNHCIKTMASIDTDALADRRLGQDIGRGSSYAMHHLGLLGLQDILTSIGVKRPLQSQAAGKRLVHELAAATVITDRAPTLRPRLPAFMGLVCIDGVEGRSVLLTEDVSWNNSLSMRPASVSNNDKVRLRGAFAEIGSFEHVFRLDELDTSVAFTVGGQERWLDFTPSPLNPFGPARPDYDTAQARVAGIAEQLTCTIPEDSPLAESLKPHFS